MDICPVSRTSEVLEGSHHDGITLLYFQTEPDQLQGATTTFLGDSPLDHYPTIHDLLPLLGDVLLTWTNDPRTGVPWTKGTQTCVGPPGLGQENMVVKKIKREHNEKENRDP